MSLVTASTGEKATLNKLKGLVARTSNEAIRTIASSIHSDRKRLSHHVNRSSVYNGLARIASIYYGVNTVLLVAVDKYRRRDQCGRRAVRSVNDYLILNCHSRKLSWEVDRLLVVVSVRVCDRDNKEGGNRRRRHLSCRRGNGGREECDNRE